MKLGGLLILCLSILALIFTSCSDDKDAKSSVDKIAPSTLISSDTPTSPNLEKFSSNTLTPVAIDEVKNISTQEVTLKSKDADDTAPVFTSPSRFSVNENQISAIKLVATDESAITYSINGVDSSSFDFNSTSGVVTFQKSPNFERKFSYTFTAIATDKAKNIVRQNISINIINIPEIAIIESFITSIDENTTIGTPIGAINILDGDNNITFNEIPNFSIDAKGVITTKSAFDYESIHSYTFELNATNAVGTSSNITLIVNINNIENNQTILEAFIPILKTGQTKTYSTLDDGNVAIGKARSYTREQDNKIVTDNATELIWQDDATADAMIWEDAIRYCEDLQMGNFTDWRLANIKELLSLNDYVRSNPAIDPVFENTMADVYWSATTFAYNKLNVWVVGFNNAHQYSRPKSASGYVRCVRTRE